jgi:hypothetical protein
MKAARRANARTRKPPIHHPPREVGGAATAFRLCDAACGRLFSIKCLPDRRQKINIIYQTFAFFFSKEKNFEHQRKAGKSRVWILLTTTRKVIWLEAPSSIRNRRLEQRDVGGSKQENFKKEWVAS